MKTAAETVLVGKDRQFNRRFLQMCGHYLIEPVACTPAAGWEKGQVERFFTPRLRVTGYLRLGWPQGPGAYEASDRFCRVESE